MDKFNIFANYALNNATYIGFTYLMFFLYIIFINNITPKEFNLAYTNIFIHFVLIFLAIMFSLHNKSLGIIYMIAFCMTFMSSYNTYKTAQNVEENFCPVENDGNEIVNIEKNSLLDKLDKNVGESQALWSSSLIARGIGLNTSL